MNNSIYSALEALIDKKTLLGIEQDCGFHFLQLPVCDMSGDPLELLLDASEEGVAIVGRGYRPFLLKEKLGARLSILALITANSANEILAQRFLPGKWLSEVSADTVAEAEAVQGKGNFMFACMVPNYLNAQDTATYLETVLDAYVSTRGLINRFITRAIDEPNKLDAEDALLGSGNVEDIFLHPMLRDLLSQYDDNLNW